MWEFETTVSEIIQRTPNIKSFRFTTPAKNLRYRTGQFFYVTIKINGNEAIHHFTISSSPTEKGYLEFSTRITDSDYKKALDTMHPGNWARLKGPEGEFTLPGKESKLAFLSGGIGITPLRSMLRYIVDKKLNHDVVLLYANNNFADIAFREELDTMANSQPNLRVEYILSGPDIPPDWKGKTGFITESLVTELIPDYLERVFYISGPPRMVFSLEEKLKTVKIPDKQVKRDYFPGYDD